MNTGMCVALAAMGLAAASAGAGQVYGNVANFQAAVPSLAFSDFNSVADGQTASVSANFGQFAYEISARTFNGNASSLFNDNGTISTNNGTDQLVIDFTGDVRAFGGEWWATDANFNEVWALITVFVSDGTVGSFLTNGPTFGGYVSDVTIDRVVINALGAFRFPTMDNFYVGTMAVVPLPPAAWAGLGMLGVIGGVRVVRRRG